MSIFKRNTIRFNDVDPLANGLADDIAREQHEPEAIHSLEDTSSHDLAEFWGRVVEDAKRDKDFFAYADD
ncbi:MAG: hypothetical protein WAS27_03550 [Candidatus Saccharimonadales bacterium]